MSNIHDPRFKAPTSAPTTRRIVAAKPWRGPSALRTSTASASFARQGGTAKLEFAMITAVIGVLIAVALSRLAELSHEGQRAGKEFKHSQERAAAALEQAACATAPASKQAAACRTKSIEGAAP